MISQERLATKLKELETKGVELLKNAEYRH